MDNSRASRELSRRAGSAAVVFAVILALVTSAVTHPVGGDRFLQLVPWAILAAFLYARHRVLAAYSFLRDRVIALECAVKDQRGEMVSTWARSVATEWERKGYDLIHQWMSEGKQEPTSNDAFTPTAVGFLLSIAALVSLVLSHQYLAALLIALLGVSAFVGVTSSGAAYGCMAERAALAQGTLQQLRGEDIGGAEERALLTNAARSWPPLT